MTKKEITTLLIVFGGGWMFVMTLVSLLNGLAQIAVQFSAVAYPGASQGWGTLLLIAGFAVAPVVVYCTLAYLLIRKSATIADHLLRFGRIDGAEVIQGAPVTGLAPVLFSLVGLYFIVSTLPSLLQTAYRWVILEGASPSNLHILPDEIGPRIAGYKSTLAYDGLKIAVAIFVLLRSTWIARLVQRFSETERSRA